VRLLLDENLSPSHAARLREAGHDALAVLDAGLGGAKDEAVRQFALEQKRTLVTVDSDFSHIVRYPPADTSCVIWLRPWPPTESVIAALLDGAIRQLTDISVEGKLWWPNPAAFAFVETGPSSFIEAGLI
jgi:predicted nuclease of predicted toxin-antitoxin system